MNAKKKDQDPWRERVESADWAGVADEVNEYGGALLPQLLTAEETVERHGVSAIRSGQRHTLALVFHDAA